MALFLAYEQIGLDLHRPILRATMERQMEQIATGALTKEQFLQACLTKMRGIFMELKEKKMVIVEQLEKFYQTTTHSSRNNVNTP